MAYSVCMPCSITFSMTLQAEILSTVFSDFLKQMNILKSFNSVFKVFNKSLPLNCLKGNNKICFCKILYEIFHPSPM